MESGTYNCKDCRLFFDSAKSLEVHIQYHPDNLVNMWMPENEERARDAVTTASSPVQHDLSSIMNSDNLVNNSNVNSVSPFPAPSPMQYEGIPSPGMQSPPVSTVPQGPSSGHAAVGFSQQSPGSYYPEYNQQIQQPIHHQYTAYQSVNYMNGYDDSFYGRGTQNNSTRFHPYNGRSPVPTPSPSGHMDIKEEPRAIPESSEILDLDSQKVLSDGSHQNTPVAPMWRPHEPFQQSSQPAMPSVSMGGVPSMHAMPQFTTHMPNQTIHHMPSMNNTVNGFSNNGGSIIGGAYHNQGYGVTAHTVSVPAPGSLGPPSSSPSPRDQAPPSEFAPNVKRPKSYKCEDCNKWFTSQGHLKRHYNTALHKNMSKQATATANSSEQTCTTPDLTRPPILSPSVKSVGEASTVSSQDEESNLSASDPLEAPPTSFQPSSSAFQPPITAVPGYQHSVPQGPSSGPGSLVNTMATMPQYNVSHNYLSDVSAPQSTASYHGHFSTTPATYTSQHSFSSTNNNVFYTDSNNVYNNFPNFHQQQGGLQGPGFHHLNDIPGPNQAIDGFNFKTENFDRLYNCPQSSSNDRPNFGLSNMSNRQEVHNHINSIDRLISPSDRLGTINSQGLLNANDIKTENNPSSLPNENIPIPSPDVGGDTGSEASLDSSESSTGTEGAHRCSDCGKPFNKMCYLTQHRTTYHEGERPFKCTICGKRFTDETIFQDHQSKHAGEKPYKCDVCPKQFNHKTDLRRHMCLHTGEKPFSCEQCGKGFIRKDHMLKHFQTHRKKAMQSANAHQPPPPPPPLVPPSLVHGPGFAVHPNHPGHPQHVSHVPHAPMNHPSHVGRGHPVHTPAVY